MSIIKVILCLLLLASPSRSLNELKLGYLVGWTGVVPGRYYAGAITKAIDDINANPDILNGTKLTFLWKNSGCSSSKV